MDGRRDDDPDDGLRQCDGRARLDSDTGPTSRRPPPRPRARPGTGSAAGPRTDRPSHQRRGVGARPQGLQVGKQDQGAASVRASLTTTHQYRSRPRLCGGNAPTRFVRAAMLSGTSAKRPSTSIAGHIARVSESSPEETAATTSTQPTEDPMCVLSVACGRRRAAGPLNCGDPVGFPRRCGTSREAPLTSSCFRSALCARCAGVREAWEAFRPAHRAQRAGAGSAEVGRQRQWRR